MQNTLDAWFIREVLVHEAALMRYLRRLWPHPDEIRDIRQDVYARVYDTARKARPTAIKSFIFTVARNIMSDRMRHARVVPIEAIGDSEALNVLVDELSPERRTNAWQELSQVGRALNRLPPRCREVAWLRKVEALDIEEIAKRQGVSVRTIEHQVFRGMRLLGEAVFGSELESKTNVQVEVSQEEEEHGGL